MSFLRVITRWMLAGVIIVSMGVIMFAMTMDSDDSRAPAFDLGLVRSSRGGARAMRRRAATTVAPVVKPRGGASCRGARALAVRVAIPHPHPANS